MKLGCIRIVFETVPFGNAFRFLCKEQLVKLRLNAMRAGVWFRALRRIDRALIDLTIKVASTVRSVTLSQKHPCTCEEAGRDYGERFFAGFEGSWCSNALKSSVWWLRNGETFLPTSGLLTPPLYASWLF